MKRPQLYFLKDQYYIDFPDDKLMKNKEMVNGIPHNRPCFLAFPDHRDSRIFWIVPISSRVEKYRAAAQKAEQKYGQCDTIRFGRVLGRQAAFLIQNMCPATEQYLEPYMDKNSCAIQIDGRIASDVEQRAKKVLALYRRGAKVIFPDVGSIYDALLSQNTQ